MISRKLYESKTEVEWRKFKLRGRVDLGNGFYVVPAGTVFSIERKLKGFHVISDPCPCCGLQVRFSQISWGCFDLILQQDLLTGAPE